MEPTRISIIEDNRVIRDNVAKLIGFHEDFVVITAHGSVESFLHTLQTDSRLRPDILLLRYWPAGNIGIRRAAPVF